MSEVNGTGQELETEGKQIKHIRRDSAYAGKICDKWFGEHRQVINIKTPHWWISSKEFFSVDVCIAGEIVDLISKGIRTMASCCGHGQNLPSVIVDTKKDILKMKKMGYKFYPQFEWEGHAFVLKTKCRRNTYEK